MGSIDQRTHDEWDEIYRTPGFAQKNGWPDSAMVAFMTRTFGRDGHDKIKVLDVGCGWGNHLHFLCAEGYDATGIDGSETACAHCRTITPNVVCGSLLELPFAEDAFDVVIDRNSIQCNTLENVADIIREVHRVLKPGGVVYSILLAHTNKPEAFHAYYLEAAASRLDRGQLLDLFKPFASVTVDEERRTYNGGSLSMEQWHVVAKKQS